MLWCSAEVGILVLLQGRCGRLIFRVITAEQTAGRASKATIVGAFTPTICILLAQWQYSIWLTDHSTSCFWQQLVCLVTLMLHAESFNHHCAGLAQT